MLAGRQGLRCHWDCAVMNPESPFVSDSSVLPIKKSNLQKVRLEAVMFSLIKDTFIFLITILKEIYTINSQHCLSDLNIL